MMRQHGRALVAGVRYMMMNLLGSSLFLIGIVILYTITGHLLMVNIHESVVALGGERPVPRAADGGGQPHQRGPCDEVRAVPV